MTQLLNFLSFIINAYMIIVFFRILLTWFSGMGNSGIQNFLTTITDPYLNWFRRFSFLRIGFLDLSPIAAMGMLSLLSRILGMLARYGKISIGVILALILQAIWGAFSFILIFLIIVLVLRLIAFFMQQNVNSPFWRVVDTISQPVLYRINRLIFKDRIVNYMTALLVSIFGLGAIYLILRILFSIVSALLIKLPF